MRNKKIQTMSITSLLIAIAIMIPMFSPIKLLIEPASFTLASHVPIMIAMFISPEVGIMVAIGATIGFFLGGFPLVVVLRALSHIVFVLIGALWIKKDRTLLVTPKKRWTYFFVLSIIHAILEVVVATIFYGFQPGFMYQVMALVGIGTIVHSLIDFLLSYWIWKRVEKLV